MDGYYVLGVIAIPYLEFGVIINIISEEENTYCLKLSDIP